MKTVVAINFRGDVSVSNCRKEFRDRYLGSTVTPLDFRQIVESDFIFVIETDKKGYAIEVFKDRTAKLGKMIYDGRRKR
jgi:hypothetical protein